MSEAEGRRISARALRAELGARSLERAAATVEMSSGTVPSVVHCHAVEGGHGNFLDASYRRILARPEWARRLDKTYTGTRLLPRAGDRWRGELECATSSDALLMNVFCYPGVLRRRGVCALLGIDAWMEPAFGVRAALAMRKGEVDRTELDMCVGETLAEAKLTEGGFGRASRDRLFRYEGLEEIFETENLPRTGAGYGGYQLVRGILAAVQRSSAYVVLLDGRRSDLQEICFRVLSAVRPAEVRHRLRMSTWQELAGQLPPRLRVFLAEKYGIIAQ